MIKLKKYLYLKKIMSEQQLQYPSSEIKSNTNWIPINETKNSANINELSFEDRISYFLNRPETIRVLKTFSYEWINHMIWIIIEYFILFNDWDGIEDYLDYLKWIKLSENNKWCIKERIKFLVQQVAKKLWIKEIKSDEDKEKIYSYFNEKFIREWYLFHSFNWAFEVSIKNKWLTTNQLPWNWEELDSIKRILAETLWWTWNFFWFSHMNSIWEISLWDYTKDIYRYWCNSPEWFYFFMGFISNKWKESFKRKDYENARKEVLAFKDKINSRQKELIEKWLRKFTLEDEIKLLTFFDRFWNLFAVKWTNPKCALIRRNSIDENYWISDSYKKFKEYLCVDDFDESIEILLNQRFREKQINFNISPEDIKIVSLPDYNQVFPVSE